VKQTLNVSAVNPAEFSLVRRPLCGPGFGFCPFANASNIFFVVSAVRSSCGGGRSETNKDSTMVTAHIEVIADDQHWSITTRPLAFDFNNSELPVPGCLTRLDSTQSITNGVQDLCRTAQHARRCGADLNEMFSDGLTDAAC